VAAEPEPSAEQADLFNPLLYAIAWRQTAAEFRALYYQGFALTQLRVEQALAAREAGMLDDARPLAVITDVDETVLLSGAYWDSLLPTAAISSMTPRGMPGCRVISLLQVLARSSLLHFARQTM